VFDANEKSWAGSATFAMVQTLSRGAPRPDADAGSAGDRRSASRRLAELPRGDRRVLARNPKAGICGLTATPNRGDGKGLREVFSNVADQITLGEMIASGHLVPPRTFVIDVGVQEALGKVRRTAHGLRHGRGRAILNKRLITEAVIKSLEGEGSARKTIVFCSTVAHAQNVCDAFVAAGVAAVLVHGELSDADRKGAARRLRDRACAGRGQRGGAHRGLRLHAHQLRRAAAPSSYKSTFIQMVGRGLRTVDPEEYPGVIKTDCIVLDFGTAS
jgi:DNA repair protein RadD